MGVARAGVRGARYTRMQEVISQQEYWRQAYLQRRYLEHASADELVQRMRDILSNITALTEAGKIGFLEPQDGLRHWLELFGGVQEEFKLRGAAPPVEFLRGASVPKPTFPSRPKAVGLINEVRESIGDKPYIAKLGKEKHLEKTFREGFWRVSPASSYSDPSLNPAQRDSELELAIYALRRKITVKSATDYYVSCLSKQLRVRLFDDFDADCCIVIRQPLEFAKRMFQAAARALAWEGWFADVRYIDPYNCSDAKLDLFLAKHFRYCYQAEMRFSWLPGRAVRKIDHLFLELGSLSDIANFFQL
jgi:hypothetical protein